MAELGMVHLDVPTKTKLVTYSRHSRVPATDVRVWKDWWLWTRQKKCVWTILNGDLWSLPTPPPVWVYQNVIYKFFFIKVIFFNKSNIVCSVFHLGAIFSVYPQSWSSDTKRQNKTCKKIIWIIKNCEDRKSPPLYKTVLHSYWSLIPTHTHMPSVEWRWWCPLSWQNDLRP